MKWNCAYATCSSQSILAASRGSSSGTALTLNSPAAQGIVTLATVTVDEYRAPVTAAWQAGSGRVLCYTGEADGKYAGAIAGCGSCPRRASVSSRDRTRGAAAATVNAATGASHRPMHGRRGVPAFFGTWPGDEAPKPA